MVTHKHPQISYVISKISACCNTKNAKMVAQTIKKRGICPRINISSAKMVTQSYKIGNTERGFARKNGNTEFEKTQKW